MIYSHKCYKRDKNETLVLLNLQLRDCYTQYECKGNLQTS